MDIEITKKHPRLRKTAPWIAGGVVVAALAVWALAGTMTSTYRAERKGLATGEVVEGEFDDFVRLNGRVESGTVVQVSALETGIVDRKWVEEGAMVEPGDVILTLHNPNLRQQILDSESQLAEKQNMLRDTELAMEKDRLQVRQDLLQARTELARKRRARNQQKSLYDERLTSREDYLKACEDYELAEENIRLLRDRLRQDSAYRSVQLAMMRESLDNMRENFELVRSRADNLTVRASHAGQLGSLDAEIGQNIPAGQTVGQINILDNYRISVEIDEHYIDRVAPGLRGSVDRAGKSYEVEVAKIYPEVTGGKFRADMNIDGSLPDNIRVGQTYYISLRLGEPARAVMVPKGSFFQATGGRWVYVLDPDGHSASRRAVKLGRQNPDYYEVIEGLSPGERVITSSYAAFGEADRITITD